MDAAARARVEELLAKAQLSNADDLVVKALRAAPNDPDALTFRARLTAFKGELDGALFVIERALKQSPTHAGARAVKGALLLEKGRGDEAKALLESVVSDEAAPQVAHYNYARLLADEGQLDKARAELSRGLEKDPAHLFMRLLLAEVEVALGEPEQALVTLEECLRAEPRLADAWLLLARVQLSLEHAPDAIRNLEEGLKHCEGHFALTELLGTTLLLSGEVAAATAHFEALAGEHDDDPDALASLGLCYAAQGRNEESEQRYRQALALDPGSVHLKTQLASLLELKGDAPSLSEAVKLLKEAVRTTGAGWEPFNDLGRLLTTRPEVSDPRRGLDLLEKARRLAEGVADPELNLAIAYVVLGLKEPASEMCAAVQANPAATDEMKAEAQRLLREVSA